MNLDDIDLHEVLERLADRGGTVKVLRKERYDDSVSDVRAEAMIMDLRSVFSRYHQCPFKRGDIVTPRPGFNLRGVGRPAVVAELFDPPKRVWSNDPDDTSHPRFGASLDMRVLTIVTHDDGHDSYMSYCVESWCFELWDKPLAIAA